MSGPPPHSDCVALCARRTALYRKSTTAALVGADPLGAQRGRSVFRAALRRSAQAAQEQLQSRSHGSEEALQAERARVQELTAGLEQAKADLGALHSFWSAQGG